MSASKVRHVAKLTAKERERLIDIAVRAFRNEPPARAMVGGDDALMPLQFRAIVQAADLEGDIFVVENKSKEIVACAIWFPPGKELFGSEESRKLGFNEMMEKIDAETRQWYKDAFPMIPAWRKGWLPKDAVDCWWLNMLATDPNHQRHGYASLLMNHAVETFDSPNILGLTSGTEQAAAFYESVDFPVRSRMVPDLPSKVGDLPVFGHYRELL